jgi:predicted outer membrane repeat protein
VISSYVEVKNCTFKNGRATNGGAIFIYESQFVSMNSNYENNQAKLYGGAVYVQDFSNFNSNGDIFIDNYAPNADAVWMRNLNDYLVVENSVFTAISSSAQFVSGKDASIKVNN